MQIQASIDILSPIEGVFAYLTDADKIIQWQTFLAKTEQLSEGAIQVGSKFRNVLRHPGFDTTGIITLELNGEVLIFEPNKRLKISAQSNIAELTVDYQLHQVEEITTLQQSADFQLRGFLLRPIANLMHGFLLEQFQADLKNLKTLVEKEQKSNTM